MSNYMVDDHNALLAYLPLLFPAVNGWAGKQPGWSKLPARLGRAFDRSL